MAGSSHSWRAWSRERLPAAMMQGTRLFDVLHNFGGVASVTPPHYFLNFPRECGFRLFCFVSTPKLYKFLLGLVSSVCLFGLGCYREIFTSRLFSLSLLSPPHMYFPRIPPYFFFPFRQKAWPQLLAWSINGIIWILGKIPIKECWATVGSR